jgi:hypothetical protein
MTASGRLRKFIEAQCTLHVALKASLSFVRGTKASDMAYASCRSIWLARLPTQRIHKTDVFISLFLAVSGVSTGVSVHLIDPYSIDDMTLD